MTSSPAPTKAPNTSAIYIGLGANLDHPEHGSPLETCTAALAALSARGVTVVAVSRWFKSAPVPESDQPWFVNGVAQVETDRDAADLLAVLHEIEADFGRVRGEPNAARTLDLDLLDFHGQVADHPALPHPRMMDRAFVLFPLYAIAPDWTHPVTGHRAVDRIATVAVGAQIEAL